jgi:hypothetical protein
VLVNFRAPLGILRGKVFSGISPFIAKPADCGSFELKARPAFVKDIWLSNHIAPSSPYALFDRRNIASVSWPRSIV